VPLPWSGSSAPFGFSPAGAGRDPWLPQPGDWSRYTVEAEAADPRSMLSLYRAALRIRRDSPELGDGPLTFLDLGPDVLAFRRGTGFLCITNFADRAIPLPAGEIALVSEELTADGALPPDSTAWLRTAPVETTP
jgi:alpha-glucosidase